MSERILDQFEEFDDPAPVEREGQPSAPQMRARRKGDETARSHSQEKRSRIKAAQRGTIRYSRSRPITLATKA